MSDIGMLNRCPHPAGHGNLAPGQLAEQRARADALALAVAEMRAASEKFVVLRWEDGWIKCQLCKGGRRLSESEKETGLQAPDSPSIHESSCILAGDAQTRGAALLEAARDNSESLAALLRHYRRHTDHRCEIDQEAETVLTTWQALAGQAQGERGA